MADYVIVGGGIYGCTVAWELAKQGADVHLLEAKTIASGASGGLGERGVRANGRDLRELPLMRMAYEQWTTLHEHIDGTTGYRRLGHLQLIEREADIPRERAQITMQQQLDIRCRFVDKGELHEIEPQLSEAVIGAIYCPLDGVADHTQTTRNIANAAQKLGAVIQENAPVGALKRQGDNIKSISATIDGDLIEIPVKKSLILLANSGIFPLIAHTFGIHLPFWRMLPQVMTLEAITPMPIKHLIGHAHRTLAIKPLPDNRVMISGGWHGQWSDLTQSGDPIPEQVEGNRQEAITVYPNLANLQVDEVFTDRTEMISIDGIPIIDTLPGASNMIIGAGWSGHGWAISPAVSNLLADWILTNKRPELLAPFNYDRFCR
jgi:sarcosine oxidase, subunit beta